MPELVLLKVTKISRRLTMNLIPLGLWLLKVPLDSRWSDNSQDTDNFHDTAVSKNTAEFFLLWLIFFHSMIVEGKKEFLKRVLVFWRKKHFAYLQQYILCISCICNIYEKRIAFCANDGAEATPDQILHIPTRCLLLFLLLQDIL